ncbi:hypothetical protein ACJMK2_028237, partial [Sinanodonta woodiana]
DVVSQVLPLAHEYQVKWIIDDCIKAMMREMDASRFVLQKGRCVVPPNPSVGTITSSLVFAKSDMYTNCCNICIMAEKYDLCSVIEKFIEKFALLNYKCYKDLSEFKQISAEVRYKI